MLLANTAQIRQADYLQINQYHQPGLLLMEQAARKAALLIMDLYPQTDYFLVLAGPGNNGGDGLGIARYLYANGKKVSVILSHPPDRYKGDALDNYRMLSAIEVPVHEMDEERLATLLAGQPLVVDSLLGTGITSTLRGTVSTLVEIIRQADSEVVAIDLPSGLSADTGEIINTPLFASHTLTFQLPKICHHVSPASLMCGQIHVVDIGIWPEVVQNLGIQREVLDDSFWKKHYRVRPDESHKGTYGHILLAGGSSAFAGALSMTALGALQAGAGLISVFGPDAVRLPVNFLVPEAMCRTVLGEELTLKEWDSFVNLLKGKSAVGIGPGMGGTAGSAEFLGRVLEEVDCPLVLDADALNILAKYPAYWDLLPASTVITPHPGEMGRLLGGKVNVQKKRLEHAEALAQEKGVTVVLKGAGTLIACPDGATYVNPTGNPGMSTGGMGDVLTGIITALLGQGYTPGLAAAIGVYTHGKAGDEVARNKGEEAVSATAVARHLQICPNP
ncbi:MAG: NAD(P)H-hydrate dehydratase [Bacteroidota bacterium]